MTAPRAGRPPASPPVVTRVWGGPAPPAQHSHITAGKWAAAVEQGGFKPRRFETMWAPGENSSEGVVVGLGETVAGQSDRQLTGSSKIAAPEVVRTVMQSEAQAGGRGRG